MTVRLYAFNTLASRTLALASRSKLQDNDVLLEFGYGTQNLPNEAARRVVAAREINAIRRQDPHANFGKLPDDDLLHHQVARKTVRPFNDDRPYSVRLQAVDQRGQAGTARQLGCARNSEVGKLLKQCQTGASGEAGNRLALAFRAISADLAFATNPDIRDCLPRLHQRPHSRRSNVLIECTIWAYLSNISSESF
jgi:hypothetical protein